MLLRPETMHSIRGVHGRLHNLHSAPPPWKPGTFANQSWVSESRRVEGFGKGARMRVTLRFDDGCNNGHNTFSVVAAVLRYGRYVAGGYMPDEVATVFPELAQLLWWHLCSTDGPRHYAANTVYWATKGRNPDAARRTAVWPDATNEQLSLPPDDLRALLLARLPVLIDEFRADMESIGFMWEAPVV